MTVLMKILSITTFGFACVAVLSMMKPFILFLVPILFFSYIFTAVTSLLGVCYYRGNDLLFYASLAMLMLTVLIVMGMLAKIITLRTLPTIEVIRMVLTVVFFGLMVFRKAWLL